MDWLGEVVGEVGYGGGDSFQSELSLQGGSLCLPKKKKILRRFQESLRGVIDIAEAEVSFSLD